MKYKLVGCGGTFDLLHRGHKKFLDFVFEQGEKAIIGITSDLYLQEFKSHLYSDDSKKGPGQARMTGLEATPFEIRKKEVEECLKEKGLIDRVEIIPLNDGYGPTVDDSAGIEAIVVTRDSLKGAEKINRVRVQKNLPVLPIEVCDFAKAEDGGIISSTRIRNGEINRDGRLYIKPEWVYKNFRLPENLREELKKPFGELIESIDEIRFLHPNPLPEREGEVRKGEENIVTVGDVVTLTFNQLNLNQKISVVDFIVERHEKFHSLSELGFENDMKVFPVNNPAGMISGVLIKIILEVFSKIRTYRINDTGSLEFVIQVNGEEDLSVLPIILTAPLGWIIFYGQPSEGIVRIVVNESVKEKAYAIFKKFEIVK